MKKINYFLVFLGIGFFLHYSIIFSQAENVASSFWEIFEKAQRYEKEGNLEKAMECYQKIFKECDVINLKKETLIAMAQLLKRQKRYNDSLEYYEKYLKMASNCWEIYKGNLEVALVYAEQGKFSQSIEILNKIINMFPVEKWGDIRISAEAQFSKANIYHYHVKDYIKAIEEYKKFMNDYPDDWRVKTPLVLLKIASCYYILKEYDELIKVYEKIIENFPNTPFEKYARICIEFTNEYEKKGKFTPPEVVMKKMKEVGLGEGIISIDRDGMIINSK